MFCWPTLTWYHASILAAHLWPAQRKFQRAHVGPWFREATSHTLGPRLWPSTEGAMTRTGGPCQVWGPFFAQKGTRDQIIVLSAFLYLYINYLYFDATAPSILSIGPRAKELGPEKSHERGSVTRPDLSQGTTKRDLAQYCLQKGTPRDKRELVTGGHRGTKNVGFVWNCLELSGAWAP